MKKKPQSGSGTTTSVCRIPNRSLLVLAAFKRSLGRLPGMLEHGLVSEKAHRRINIALLRLLALLWLTIQPSSGV
jgi:hypothetical protein